MGNFIDRVTGAEANRLRAQRDGTYFATIDTIMTGTEESFDDSHFGAIRRTTHHKFYKESIEAANARTESLWPAIEAGRSEFDPGSDGSSLMPLSQDGTSTKNRKRKLHEITLDGQENATAQIMHLIPYSYSCSRLFGPIAEACCGFTSARQHKRRKLQHEVLLHGQYEVKVVNGQEKTQRKNLTGIKHCRTNMARVVGQAQFLDFNPSMLILPIMTRQTVLDYAGGPFDILVVCKTASVYRGSALVREYDVATPQEIREATGTLSAFVKGFAHCLAEMTDDAEIGLVKPDYDRAKVVAAKKEIRQSKTVRVPTLADFGEARVIKLSLSLVDIQLHQECDPYLLFVKSGIAWSAMQNQKLFPGCPSPHDCEECLELGLFNCDCEGYDPSIPIPEVVVVPARDMN